MKRISVFCGSSPGRLESYTQAAEELGRLLAERKITLVYGGASIGIMGLLADAVLRAGGEVIGVMPGDLATKGVVHKGLTELIIVNSMHARKSTMVDLSDAFLALPGGLGTLEEIFEVIAWAQLSLHAKPCGFLNVNGYYDMLMSFLDHAVEQQFIEKEHRSMILIDSDLQSLLKKFEGYQPSSTDKAAWAAHQSKKEIHG